MSPLTRIVILAVGGGLGVNARYWLGLALMRWPHFHLPWGTFLINVTGSLALGFLATALRPWAPGAGHPLRLLLLVGFLGGYTTFSTFSFEILALIERGSVRTAMLYITLSVGLGLAGVAAGAAAGHQIANRISPPTVVVGDSP